LDSLVHLPVWTVYFRLLAVRRATPGWPIRRAGRAGADQGTVWRAAMRAPPRVTSRRVHTWQMRSSAAVHYPRTARREDGPAAHTDGDIGGRDEIAVPGMPAVRADEDSPSRFRHPPGACGTGRGCAPLIDQRNANPGPSRLNVPEYQRTGIRLRLRRGNRAFVSPALRRLAAANQASEYRRKTDRAPSVSNSPNVPGPDDASSRHSSWYPASGAS
jgi:hypothetical protein